MTTLSSRERMLRTSGGQEADHVPCCFMSFAVLRKRHHENRYEVAKAELAMGLDTMLFTPAASRAERPEHPDLRGLPVRFDPRVRTREWYEGAADEFGILHRQYTTPGGTLTTSVQLSADWPHGKHIPFVDDYQVPRMIKPLVTGPRDLDALSYLLTPPSQQDVAYFKQEAQQAEAFAREYGILIAGGWGVGMDLANWLCGMQNLMFLTMDDPGFVGDLLDLIHRWNRARMQVVLSAPVDLYIRRAWYEGCDFVTPRVYRELLLPHLRAEVDLAHANGARFGTICSSGTVPLLDLYLEAGIDVLIGVDPAEGTHTDMALMKNKFGGHVCLWGGVSGAVTVEQGSEEEVREAVRVAIDTLGPTGFILSPVDNITVDTPQTWRNLNVFIDAWQRYR